MSQSQIEISYLNVRLPWVDFCKGIAIIGVIIDHCYGTFYKSTLILHQTAFCVSLFVFIGGVTSMISLQNSQERYLNNIIRRIQRIIIPFLFSTLLWSLYNDEGTFILLNYLSLIVNFNATDAYYFICFFIQLIALSPVIYFFIYKFDRYYFHLLLVCFAVIVSAICQKSTIVLNLHGGGKYLFGGSYLFVFTLGFIFYRYLDRISTISPHKSLLLSIVSLLGFEVFNLLAGSWSNPPNYLSIIYTLIIFSIVYFSYTVFRLKYTGPSPPKENINILIFFQKPIRLLGKHSLQIFLFHNYLPSLFIDSQFIYAPIYAVWLFGFAIIPSIVINDYFFNKISNFFRTVYSLKKGFSL